MAPPPPGGAAPSSGAVFTGSCEQILAVEEEHADDLLTLLKQLGASVA